MRSKPALSRGGLKLCVHQLHTKRWLLTLCMPGLTGNLQCTP